VINVEAWNATFSRYPMTVHDKGWVYGVWYCGTAWQKVKLHGQYPPGFLARALALFPDAKRILHCPSGTVTGPGVTVDLIRDEVRCPQIVASADALPFAEASFDLYLTDPPYTAADAAKYGTAPYPMAKAMREAHRVVRPDGYFGVLHTWYPSYRRRDWALEGLIAVVTGFMRATRVFSIFRRRP
jgi:SAM-dependent methyltransferase